MGQPANLQELVLDDLEWAQRTFERSRRPFDPQVRVATPQGDFWIVMPLSKNGQVRGKQMGLLSDFMAWKKSPGFVLLEMIEQPEAIVAIGVMPGEAIGASSLITRQPLRYGLPEFFGPELIDAAILELLPMGPRDLSRTRIRELRRFFGPDGTCPAIKLE
jgi:hypothetical protein